MEVAAYYQVGGVQHEVKVRPVVGGCCCVGVCCGRDGGRLVVVVVC